MRVDNTHLLRLADAGAPVSHIADALHITPGRVYTILRRERPNRPRKSRTPTSNRPDQVRALVAAGASTRRAAELLGVTRQYAYKIVKTAGNGE